MEPVYVLPDATKVILGYLRPLVAARPETVCEDVTIGRTVKPSDGRVVQVRSVAGSQFSPAHDRVQVDFLIWHPEAMALAQILRALCRAAAGDETDAGRLIFSDELMRPTDTIDPLDGDTPQVMFRHEFFIR